MPQPLQLSPRLPDALSTMCGRIATERHRAAVWTEARNLKAFCRQRLKEGENIITLTRWLGEQLESAVMAQHK